MEKISHIVPASARQVWASGETDKPRRVTEPNVEERASDMPELRRHDSIPAGESNAGLNASLKVPFKGGKLNMMA